VRREATSQSERGHRARRGRLARHTLLAPRPPYLHSPAPSPCVTSHRRSTAPSLSSWSDPPQEDWSSDSPPPAGGSSSLSRSPRASPAALSRATAAAAASASVGKSWSSLPLSLPGAPDAHASAHPPRSRRRAPAHAGHSKRAGRRAGGDTKDGVTAPLPGAPNALSAAQSRHASADALPCMGSILSTPVVCHATPGFREELQQPMLIHRYQS